MHSASANGGGGGGDALLPAWTWAVVGVGAAIIVACVVVLGVSVVGWWPRGTGTLQEMASGTAHTRLDDDAELEDFRASGHTA